MGSPVDDALDRLDERAAGSGIDDEDVALIRSAVERLREAMENGDRLLSQAGRQLEAAEAEVRRLKATPPLTRITELEAINAQFARQVRRFTEGLRGMVEDADDTGRGLEQHSGQGKMAALSALGKRLAAQARALLSASPSDGGGS